MKLLCTGMPFRSWAPVLPWPAIQHCTSAFRPCTTLHIAPTQAVGVSDSSPIPPSTCVQPAQYISDKSSQGPSKSWEVKYRKIFFFFNLSKLLSKVWYCVREKETENKTGDTQHSPLSAHETGLCGPGSVWQREVCVPGLLCCWALGSREKRRKCMSVLPPCPFWRKTHPGHSKCRRVLCCSHPSFGSNESTDWPQGWGL